MMIIKKISRLDMFFSIAIAALTIAIYAQTAGFDFVNLDDEVNLLPEIRTGLSWENIVWAFKDTHQAMWQPLVWISFQIDAELGGMKPSTFHITNFVLHTINAILLYAFLRLATGAIVPSAFVAALFAVHPLHVESVAWVTERKDTLSSLFWMLTMLAYYAYAKTGLRKWHICTTIAFVLGLMSKPMLVSLPLVLFLLDIWPLKRFTEKQSLKPLLLEKMPWIAISAIFSVIAVFTQKGSGAVAPLDFFPLGVRLANASVAAIVYLQKMAYPYPLAAFYPHPGAGIPIISVVFCTVALGIITYSAIAFRKKAAYFFVGWMWYLITLLPVIGIVQIGGQAMADRYTYIPLIGVFFAITWLAYDKIYLSQCVNSPINERVISKTNNKRRSQKKTTEFYAKSQEHCIAVKYIWASLCIVIVLAYSVRAYSQVGAWKNGITLWRSAIAQGVTGARNYYHLGHALIVSGVPENIRESIKHFNKALELNPKYVSAANELADAYRQLNETSEAIAAYKKAIELSPNNAKAHYNLGCLLQAEGRYKEAIEHYSKAIEFAPRNAEPYYNRGTAYHALKNYPEAIRSYLAALEIKPSHKGALNNIASIFVEQGKYKEACVYFDSLTKLTPNDAVAWHNYGVAKLMSGEISESISLFRKSLQLDPNYAQAQRDLDYALRKFNQTR